MEVRVVHKVVEGRMKSLLNKLATKLVGDGNSPNLYFVTTCKGHTIAVCTKLEDARTLGDMYGASTIEDRKHGEV